jgi:cytochrome d ubiquinol oxidase subunit II
MASYDFLQHYWWFVISLLGGLLVFLMFVQGGQSLIFSLGKDPKNRRMLVNSTGRKWDLTFTTLVTFGAGFFASFPLFYSTSFPGAYWVWILIFFLFVMQAVSYEYQNRKGNVWGSKTYQICLFLNGVLAPILIGTAVATFFTGANFSVNPEALTNLDGGNQNVSTWLPYTFSNGNSVQLRGLEAVFNPMNVVLGLAIFFLTRVTALLYFINNITDQHVRETARKRVPVNAILFLVTFLAFVIYILLSDGFAVNPDSGEIFMEPNKYWNNLIQQPALLIAFLVGVVLVLYGIGITIFKKGSTKGIWYHGFGVVITVTTVFLLAGWNNTSFYPSLGDLQSSLTIQNASSSQYTLNTMMWVSFLIPFVLAYIIYVWNKMDIHKINHEAMETEDKY